MTEESRVPVESRVIHVSPALHHVPSPRSSFLDQGQNRWLATGRGLWLLRDSSALPSELFLSVFCHQNLFILNTEGINIPADQPITKLKNLEDVVVPTMEIKVIYY